MSDNDIRSLEIKQGRTLDENLRLANYYMRTGRLEEAMGLYWLVLEEKPDYEAAILHGGPIIRRLPEYPIRQITDLGQESRELAPKSITLAEDLAQFQHHLLRRSYGANKNTDSDCRFDHIGRGEITNDACAYNDGDRSMRRVKPTDRRVLWIQKVLGFRKRRRGWQAITGSDSKEYKLIVPGSGFAELTDDGFCRPDTGTPFSTIPEKDKYGNRIPEERQMWMAIESWLRRGYPSWFAGMMAWLFISRHENQGTAVVACYSILDYHLMIDAEDKPDNSDRFIGAVYPE